MCTLVAHIDNGVCQPALHLPALPRHHSAQPTARCPDFTPSIGAELDTPDEKVTLFFVHYTKKPYLCHDENFDTPPSSNETKKTK